MVLRSSDRLMVRLYWPLGSRVSLAGSQGSKGGSREAAGIAADGRVVERGARGGGLQLVLVVTGVMVSDFLGFLEVLCTV